MNLGLHFAAATGFVALVALSVPAAATTFNYDLTGDGIPYTIPGVPPEWSFVDLTDTSTGSSDLGGFRLSTGDKVQVTVTLAHPITFTGYSVWLQNAPSVNDWVYVDPTSQYFLNGVAVPAPSSNWAYTSGSGGVLSFGETYALWGTNTFSFDQLIVDATITGLTDDANQSVPFLDMTDGWASITVFDARKIATTPLPGSLALTLSALGSLAIVGWRKCAAREGAGV